MSVLRTFAVAATAVVVTVPIAGATAAQAGVDAPRQQRPSRHR